jgi:threonylcarbamoyladenosine tRNA methylthiotransferase CDKAL1
MDVYIETYGCTANKSDERLLIGLLEHSHHRIVSDMKDADVLVLLTCTVIGTTEQRMISRLRIFQKTHKPVIVAGCMPSVQPELITAVVPDAILLPAQFISSINDVIAGSPPAHPETKKTLLPKRFDGVIAPIAIAEGCLLSCSYCITRVARGTLRSFPVDEIAADLCLAVRQGCKEIQLTAQDTASYGLDIGTNLGDLLQKISSFNGEFRVRVGMMNPATLKKNITPILAGFQRPHIYHFLHVPVQSGDDAILRTMNRRYSVQEFIRIVERFRKALPDLTISTDVIVGFPGETNAQFRRTIELLQHIQPDIINITRFSARPFTTAKTMKGRIPTHIVKERSIQITDVCSKITLEKNKAHLGKHYAVLITEHGKHGTVTGRAENYKQIVLKEPAHIGDIVSVEVIEVFQTYLVGRLI